MLAAIVLDDVVVNVILVEDDYPDLPDLHPLPEASPVGPGWVLQNEGFAPPQTGPRRQIELPPSPEVLALTERLTRVQMVVDLLLLGGLDDGGGTIDDEIGADLPDSGGTLDDLEGLDLDSLPDSGETLDDLDLALEG